MGESLMAAGGRSASSGTSRRPAFRLGGDGLANNLPFYLYLILLAACFAGGGGSRDDVLSLLYVRPVAALCLIAFLFLPGPLDFRAIRMPFWLLVWFTLLTAIHLIPLPADWWAALPGREPFVPGAELMGISQPWRPISLAPDLTRNALASMIVPFAALIGFAKLDPTQREHLITPIIVLSLFSALLAVLQLASGGASSFYLYRITNEGAAVGAFANRNHQAMLLAVTLPMLAIWASRMRGDAQARQIKRASIVLVAVLFLLMLMVTGSRAGLVLGGVASFWAGFQYIQERAVRRGRPAAHGRSLILAFVAVIAIGGALTFLAFGRAETLQRLAANDFQVEQRVQIFPRLVALARDYFPVGSGLGSFDPVFRAGEPLELLSAGYLNHAHNDLLELAITGGVPALVLLLVLIGWWLWRSVAAFRLGESYAVLGSATVLLLLIASLVDYPLRTPMLTVLFSVACGWLGGTARPRNRSEALAS
ncbi:MAG: O-antigen ligase family protein [Sphingomonas sp.]|nr:O-antigen ligase family protein [Sphingomonas sp.]